MLKRYVLGIFGLLIGFGAAYTYNNEEYVFYFPIFLISGLVLVYIIYIKSMKKHFASYDVIIPKHKNALLRRFVARRIVKLGFIFIGIFIIIIISSAPLLVSKTGETGLFITFWLLVLTLGIGCLLLVYRLLVWAIGYFKHTYPHR